MLNIESLLNDPNYKEAFKKVFLNELKEDEIFRKDVQALIDWRTVNNG